MERASRVKRGCARANRGMSGTEELARRGAAILDDGFARYDGGFEAITERAKSLFEQRDCLERRNARHRIAAKRAGVRPGGPGHDLAAGHDRSQRQTRRNSLGQAHDVGLDTEMLAGKHPAGAAHSRLDLVDH